MVRFITATDATANASVYPRWRGEHRGTGKMAGIGFHNWRGNTPFISIQCCAGGLYHWRGNAIQSLVDLSKSGFYPRWRGNTHASPVARPHTPFIPTGAGNTGSLIALNKLFWADIPAGAGTRTKRISLFINASLFIGTPTFYQRKCQFKMTRTANLLI
ncbi:hypothetical protein KCP77_06905 [Salmonella enterica subsp. enterica]|nr:hypothetical protein KCP77_06905 [Salmonella enterica subsp. enterica]